MTVAATLANLELMALLMVLDLWFLLSSAQFSQLVQLSLLRYNRQPIVVFNLDMNQFLPIPCQAFEEEEH